MPAYVSEQAVLQEAGLWHRKLAETPAGSVNASNKVFTVTQKPLADNNYDDSIDPNDVTVYVNDSSVDVVSVNETTGEITLATAPANGATVTIDYSYSAIATDYVEDLIEETAEWINDEMGQVVTTPYRTVPKTVRRIARTYAAGLLLSREYGMQTTGDETREGSRKIKQAEAWLAAYRSRIEENGSDAGTVAVPRSSADSRLFQTYDESEGNWKPLSDESVTLNEVG